MAERTPLHDVTARAGAAYVEDAGYSVPDRFGDPAAEYNEARAGAVLFDLSPRGKVEVSGPDARTFLHNISTNDVKNLPAGTGCEAFLTTAKAKVVAYLTLWLLPEQTPSFWLDLAPGTSGNVIKHLDHFLISEQVEFADHTRAFAQVHLAGPRARAVLAQNLGGPLPELDPLQLTLAAVNGVACQVRRHDVLGLPGYDLVCPQAGAGGVWEGLAGAGAKPAGRQTYETLRVEAGTPLQGVDVDEDTFAPEVGRTRQAISYTKGCYLGQEPIVMARDRGHVNRVLTGLKLAGDPVPHNSPLYREGKEVGRVTSSVVSPRLGTIALAYVRRGNQEPGRVLEVEAEGQRRPAEVASLPFAG
jgi:folate-binding protein YgfZ